MKFRNLAAVATVAIGALGVTAGTAYADTVPLPAENTINYEAKLEDKSVVTTVDAGAFKVSGDGKTVELQDATGKPVVSLPLAYQLGDLQFPFDKKVSEDGKSLTLTPMTDPAKATPIAATDLVLQDVASIDENTAAQSNFATQLGLATAVGGLAGTIVGALAGGLGFLGGPVGLVSVPAGAAIGAILGTIVVGGPTLVIAGVDFLNTLNAAPGTTMWAKK